MPSRCVCKRGAKNDSRIPLQALDEEALTLLMKSVKEHKAAAEELHVTGPALSKDASQRSGHTKAGTAARRRAAARHQDSSACDEVIVRQMHVVFTVSDCEDICSCGHSFYLHEVIMPSMLKLSSVRYEALRKIFVDAQGH